MVYQWLIAAITLLIPAFAGVALVSWLKLFREKILTYSVGSVFGVTLYGTIAYAAAYIVPITPLSVAIQLGLFCIIAISILHPKIFYQLRNMKTDWVGGGIFIVSIILFSIIGSKLLIERPDGLYTGIINAYGDIGWHGAIIMGLSEQGTLPMEDPIFTGERLTYPFLANLISATMVSLGSSLAASINVPAILLIPCLLVLIYIVGKDYGESKQAGIIACALFLFGGAALGWIRLPPDIAASTTSIGEFFLHLPTRDYSGVGTDVNGFHFLNPVTSLLLPQRAMLFGIPIVLSVLLLIHPKRMKRQYAPIVAGLLAGMLPLFHAHACIALSAAILAMLICYPVRSFWVRFFCSALLIGIPELFFYMNGSAVEGSFFRYGPGWMAGTINHIVYWIQNTGIYIPLSIAALCIKKVPKSAKALTGAGTFLFILADTFLFAPWAWDNFKLFVFWLIFILPIIAWCAATLIKRTPRIWIRLGVLGVIFIHIFAGILDIYKLTLPTATTWLEWDQNGIYMARAIQRIVPPKIPVLTAPVHNSPAILSGRSIFLGYPAHIWSHGGTPWEREREIKSYFAEMTNTIEGEDPRYVLVGPQENIVFKSLIIRPTWNAVASYGPYTLYRTN